MQYLAQTLGDLLLCLVRVITLNPRPRWSSDKGTFTSVYKFLINAIPILVSPSSSSTAVDGNDDIQVQVPITTTTGVSSHQETRLHLSARAQSILIRKKTRRWHATVAGAVAGGLAIIWEKKNRRSLISQQLFVRSVAWLPHIIIPDNYKAACKGLIIHTHHAREFTSLTETF